MTYAKTEPETKTEIASETETETETGAEPGGLPTPTHTPQSNHVTRSRQGTCAHLGKTVVQQETPQDSAHCLLALHLRSARQG